MKFTITLFLIIFYTFFCTSQSIKNGIWNAKLQLNNTDVLPFILKVDKNNQLTILNGEENIQLEKVRVENDSLRVRFPFFNSEIVFVNNNKNLTGYWVNYQRNKNYKIPFYAKKVKRKSPRFLNTKNKKENIKIEGKWEIKFEPGTEGEYPAIGLFHQEKNKIKGTFLTETGDYRFLEGNTTKDSLYLSCFDGSHAFLFKAILKNDSLIGTFNSGSHWKSKWEGVLNESFELPNPEKLTYLINDEPITFSFPNLEKDTISFPNDTYKNKVVIVQIMGTWCPNCLDETILFKEMYEKYHLEGLEIIAVCYESGKTLDDNIRNAKRLRDKLKIEYPFLIGGSAKKNDASEDFPMLNNIMSFPTTIIIGRDGEVKQIYTGFNGPGTGEYYITYKKKLNILIQSLLNIN